MQIEIKELTNELVEFQLKGINTAMANGFRRIILAEVPTFAIGDVLVETNTSIHINDYISQRLGLLPIDSNDRLLIEKMPIECNCPLGVCDSCGIIIDVNMVSTKHKHRIFIKDLFPNNYKFNFTKNAFEIPLFVLNTGEQFKARIIIRKGIGHQDAKYKPASVVIAKPTPQILIHDVLLNEQYQKLVSICPQKIFQFSDNTFSIVNVGKCIYCQKCTQLAIEDFKMPDIITVKPIKDDFIFTIESVGTLRPDLIFMEAVRIMKEKVNQLDKSCH